MKQTVMKVFLIWNVMVFCAFSENQTMQGKEMKNDVLSKEVTLFQLSDGTMEEAVKSLRRQGIRVCLEIAKKGETKKTIQIRNQSVERILDDLVGEFDDYSWSLQEHGCLVKIHPKGKSVLKWNVRSLRIENRSFFDVLVREDLLGFKEHGIMVFYRGFSQPLEVLVDIEIDEQSVSTCFDNLVSQVPELCWTLSTNPKGIRVLTFQFVKGSEPQSK